MIFLKMDDSIQSAVKRIKLQEKENEEKLREKREYESAVAMLNRNIRDTTALADKLSGEVAELIPRIDKLSTELDMERIRNKALLAQIKETSKELEKLRADSNLGVTNVWKIRESLCTAVQNSTNEWNIQALLTKRKGAETSAKTYKKQPVDDFNYDDKLKIAKEKLANVMKERDRLLNEPDNGEEFVRIKNALHYSEEMIAKLKDRNDL